MAALVTLTACGDAADSEPVDTEQDEPEETDEPVETPETTAPATTVAVETTTTVVPTTTEPTASAAFCEAAEDFYLPGRALDFGDTEDPVVVEGVFDLANARVQAPIDLASTPEDAELFTESKRLLDIATPGLEAGNYDITNPQNIPNNVEVGEAVTDYGRLLVDIQAFLPDRCGTDIVSLDAEAEVLAVGLAAGSATTEGIIRVQNDDGTIIADVPDHWSETDGAPSDELRQLSAAPDLDAFLNGYTEPGMLVITGDAPNPDAWTVGLDSTIATAETDGCSVSEELDYDDGVYTGLEKILDCGDPSSTARIIGGRDADGTLFFLLAIVAPSNAPEIRDLIVESFLL